MTQLPSLRGLRAVEAAARLGSFTTAAAELHVTQTAVSRLVRQVEEQLGIELFRRHANMLTLTESGGRLLPHLSAGFARLRTGVEELREHSRALTLACGPAFAMRWLIPRLARFHARHPDIDVRLATALASEAPELRSDWDAAIRLLPGVPAGLAGAPLFGGRLLPVARPDVAAGLTDPADLANQTLLAVGQGAGDWPRWFAAAGIPLPTRSGFMAFDSAVFALQAALDGLGVALIREPYVEDDLAAGRLVTPFDLPLEDRGRVWYLVFRPEMHAAPALAAFRDWLVEPATGRPADTLSPIAGGN